MTFQPRRVAGPVAGRGRPRQPGRWTRGGHRRRRRRDRPGHRDRRTSCWADRPAISGRCPGQVIGDGSGVGPASTALATECQTGADANAREDCRIVGYVNSIQAYWTDEFARPRAAATEPARTRFFTGQIIDRLRLRQRGVGPVLLPGRPVRLHRPRVLRRPADEVRRAAAARSPRPTSSPTSTATTSRTSPGALTGGSGGSGRERARSVRTELQADCYAGVWANNAADDRLPRTRSPTPRSPTRSTRPRPSATTGSRSETQGGGRPRTRGPTARPPSARSGSRPATRSGDPDACDTFSGTP